MFPTPLSRKPLSRSITGLEAAIKTLEEEFQDIEALKVEVSPMKSVKDGATVGDDVKKSGAQLHIDIRILVN